MNFLPKEEYLVDRSSPMPAYQQIATSIMDRIGQGEWELHEKIPSENVLAKCYGVSRVTLRQALSLLEKDEIIKKHQGKGVFVIGNPNLVVQDLSFPTLGKNKSKRKPIPSKVLTIAQDLNPSKKVRLQLQLEKGKAVVYLKRLFVSEDRVTGVNNVWLPLDLVPGFVEDGLINFSVSGTLRERYGYNIAAIDNQIEATKLDATTAQLLDAAYDAPALKIDSIHTLDNGLPVEFASTTWLGDIIRFHFRVTQDD